MSPILSHNVALQTSTRPSTLRPTKLLHLPFPLICPSPWVPVNCLITTIIWSQSVCLTSLLSDTVPFPRDKGAGKLSSPRAPPRPCFKPSLTLPERPLWKKLYGKNPTPSPFHQEAYLFSISLDQLPILEEFERILRLFKGWVRDNRNGSFTLLILPTR